VAWAILDTDVYIAYWERGLFEREMSLVEGAFVVRHSAVVLSELRRGARSEAARRHGATVVTANRADFTLLASALRISLLVPPTQRGGK